MGIRYSLLNQKLIFFWIKIFPGYSAKLSPEMAALIAKDSVVESVSPNLRMKMVEPIIETKNFDLNYPFFDQNWGLDRLDQVSIRLDRNYSTVLFPKQGAGVDVCFSLCLIFD